MSPYQRQFWSDPDYIHQVLAIYAQADSHDEVVWWTDDDGVAFLACCNDLFYWATADAEQIMPDDLPLLASCLADLGAADTAIGSAYLSELFAARKRQMRPQAAFYRSDRHPAAVLDLFDAAGPERTDPDGKKPPHDSA